MAGAIPGISQSVTDLTQSLGEGTGDKGADFTSTLKSAMDQIGQLQSSADSQITNLLAGSGEDIHSAMIAVEKANLAFDMMVQVRNKIVQAYQQISQMPF